MTYITVRQHRKPREITIEDVLFDLIKVSDFTGESDRTGTITRKVDTIKPEILARVNVGGMIDILEKFNEKHKDLFEADRESLYYSFKIPKSTGGWRDIDAPNEQLKLALSELAHILSDDFGILYHTAAFAYIPGRDIVMTVKKHADFKSNWYLKTDLSGFFPSHTLPYIMKMLGMVFPTSEIVKTERGRTALEKAISLGLYKDRLTQGSPLSPALSNWCFIPIDHKLFAEFTKRKLVYTRWADDIHISGQEQFPYKEMIQIMKDTFKEFDAPFEIKNEKTHYGSVKWRNWILGLMSTADYRITVGHQRKKCFKGWLTNFILDTKNGKPWSLTDVNELSGMMSYYKMVEKKYFTELIERANKKWDVDVEKMIKSYKTIG